MNDNPVIILGAPRSGTSLLQKLIREVEGFASVPRESDMIWLPHCHPSLNDWDCEGCPDSRITSSMIDEIRESFSTLALSARTWRTFDRLHLMDRPRLAKILRLVYRLVFNPWKRLRQTPVTDAKRMERLVDKSVHAGLWPNLVDAVFPHACYVHIVRSPLTAVPSMMHGWQMPDRFRTYRLPASTPAGPSASPDWWCFPMPVGWREHLDADLVDICAFQWCAINESIRQFLSRPGMRNRCLRIHLEDLTANPERVLGDLADFAGIPPRVLNHGDTALPTVNASDRRPSISDDTGSRIAALTAPVHASLRD